MFVHSVEIAQMLYEQQLKRLLTRLEAFICTEANLMKDIH
jgi:hypothetical protein